MIWQKKSLCKSCERKGDVLIYNYIYRVYINNMLNVIVNEIKCIEKQVNGMCYNKRDCGKCELRMDDNLILEAYTHITELINERLEEIKNGRVV